MLESEVITKKTKSSLKDDGMEPKSLKEIFSLLNRIKHQKKEINVRWYQLMIILIEDFMILLALIELVIYARGKSSIINAINPYSSKVKTFHQYLYLEKS